MDRSERPPKKPLDKGSLRALSNQYLQWLFDRGLSPETTEVRRRVIVRLAIYANGRHITQDLLRSYFADLEGNGLASHTLHSHKRSLNHFFRWMVKFGHAKENPLKEAEIELPRVVFKTETFSKAEYEKIKAASVGTWIYHASVLAYNTGMRISDVSSVTWRSVDLEREVISYIPVKLRKINRRCTVPIVRGGDLCVMLHEMVPFVTDPDSTIVSKDVDQKANRFGMFMRKIGIRGKTFHTFRRTFITNMLSSGADSYLVMAVAGITSHTTMKHYYVPQEDSLRAALEKAAQYSNKT